jgi:uncharacterized protein (DUF58 family)
MSKRSIFLVPLIILIVALLGGFVLTFVLFYAVLFLLVMSYLWVYLTLRHLEVQVEGPAGKYEVGQLLEEQVTINNPGKLPKVSIMVTERSDLPGHSNGRVLTLSGRGSFSWKSVTPCQMRGSFTLGPFAVTSEDPFGLFRRTKTYGTPRNVLVYPTTVDLPGFQLVSLQNQGRGRNYKPTRSIAPSAAWVRDYASGDGLSRIHWRSTARVGKLMVKEFDVELSDEVWIALDLSEEGQGGFGRESTVEYGVTIAASLSRKCLEADCSLGLVAYAGKAYRLLAQAGVNHLRQVMESLALMKAEGKQSMAQLLYQERGLFGSHTHLIIITYQIDPELRAILHRFPWGRRATVILVDRSSFQAGAQQISSLEPLLDNGGNLYTVRKGDKLESVLSI